MKKNFCYADMHCHPNLKTFGHSFDRNKGPKSDLWHSIKPSFYSRSMQKLTGITKFSQTDLSTMTRAKAKIAYISLYPFEKGFFINKKVWPPLAAWLADWGIEIGYERVRYLQQHADYFSDLLAEYQFLLNCSREYEVDGDLSHWSLCRNWVEIEQNISKTNTISVLLTIEGAHVFNTGLSDYGVQYSEEKILANIQSVKNWEYKPLFIGLAHNFYNDLCGHARSLQRLGKLVNQERNIDTGISKLGQRVIHSLLDNKEGKRILIDLKHMSLKSRQEYFQILKTDYASQRIPLIVSHGSVTGHNLQGNRRSSCPNIFNSNDLNFFDEEILEVVQSDGLLAIQMDLAVNADPRKLKHFLQDYRTETPIHQSARIIWNQLQHVAEVCDNAGLCAWNSTAIGSDFDGSIHPFPGILTAAGLEPLARELISLADNFLLSQTLSLPENRNISAEEVVDRFMYMNTQRFLKEFYTNNTR